MAFNANASSQDFNQLLDQRQANTSATVLPGVTIGDAVKAIKDAIALPQGNLNPRIRNSQFLTRELHLHRNSDRFTFWGVLTSIVQ